MKPPRPNRVCRHDALTLTGPLIARALLKRLRVSSGFSPANPTSPVVPDSKAYTAVCGDGTFSVQLGLGVVGIQPGTYTVTDPGNRTVDGVSPTLQVTKGAAKQLAEGSPNLESATVEITEHDPDVLIAGTFTATWSQDVTVDLTSISWSWACGGWSQNGCYQLGMPTPAGCECTTPPTTFAGTITGSFRYEF